MGIPKLLSDGQPIVIHADCIHLVETGASDKNKQKPDVSIIVPLWNEEGSVESLMVRVHKSLSEKKLTYELIFVDDHSTDNSLTIIKKYTQVYPIRIFSKNTIADRGKWISIVAGAKQAKSDIVAMLDADLQYPPEVIPQMFTHMRDHGVVVASRKTYHTTKFRHFASRLNAVVFGKILHGLPYDIQSGLKMFRKDIIEHLNVSHISAWAGDLSLLYTARELGYTIKSVNIHFSNRSTGQSKIHFFQAALAIVSHAIRLKLLPRQTYTLDSDHKSNMVGAGYVLRGKKYITHSTLSHRESAILPLDANQKKIFLFIIILLGAGFLIYPTKTLVLCIGILSLLYFIDVLFNLYLIVKSLYNPPEILVSEREINALEPTKLPVYSILCPLYKESSVLPQFIDSIATLDWPKDKLDVQLLLEADDVQTIQAAKDMNLPPYMRVVIVPDSQPKTKPKACNYGLSQAKGEFIVIYDAEDKPDPDQLKKSYIAFSKSNNSIACLQAKLNYYNPNHNLLTRLFTAEYSLWFDVVLTGLQALETGIPLGGTSNHFRTHDLIRLQGWDAFNVTEDCDLGARLFKSGHKTAIIDSTTLEEANSDVANWIRQRSRWIKGYMQTYFVHMRHPGTFFKDYGIHSLLFQLVVGGKIAFILINPILWLLTISYFALYNIVGPTIESLYPTVIFYMAVTSLVFGNFLCIFYYMIGCAKRGQYDLVKYIFFVPFYWLLVSTAAVKSLIQLIYKPHYWEKTHHGLHLASNVAFVKSHENKLVRKNRIRIFASSGVGKGAFYIFAIITANFFNFLYNAYLGRVVSLEEFGLVTLIGSFLYLTDIPFSALSQTVTYRSAFILGKFGYSARNFWSSIRQRFFIYGVVATFVWLLLIPFTSKFFHSSSYWPLILFAPIWTIGALAAVDNGFISGNLKFTILALVIISEAVLKFILTVIFVTLGLDKWIYSVIPMSMFASFLIGWKFARSIKTTQTQPNESILKFPAMFYATSLMQGISAIAFLSSDILLVKHFLPADIAGKYALLSLSGKIVYFLGSAIALFVTPAVSKAVGSGWGARAVFLKLLTLSSISSYFGYIGIGIFGWFTVPLLFGPKTETIIQFLPQYTLAILLFTITRNIVQYQQIKNRYIYSLMTLEFAIIEIGWMYLHHSNIGEIVSIIYTVSVTQFSVIVIVSALAYFYEMVVGNLRDLVLLFKPIHFDNPHAGGKRILIYNWRDIQHKWSGGAEVYIHEMAKRWHLMGNSVVIFCGINRNNKDNEIIDGVHIIRHGGAFSVYLWACIYYLVHFRGKFDVIIDSENGVPFFTPLYAKEKIFLLIHHVHQQVFRKSLMPPFSWIAEFMERRAMPYVYRKIKVITVSPSSKADILTNHLTDQDPILVYCGVDVNKYKPGEKSKTPLVLYLGRLKSYKSINIFIESAARILKQSPSVRFVIAGFGEEQAKLENLCMKLGISDKIEFLGKISEELKIKLFQQAWVFVNPSLMEGWGITTIEANACGTPTVASNVAGLRDSVYNPHSGFLVPYGDVDEFTNKITLLIEDKKIRTLMSQESVQWAKKFDWNKSAKHGLEILNQ